MADDGFRVFFCFVQGDSAVFKVKASVNDDVADLKKRVFEILDIDNQLRADKLILWKVSIIEVGVSATAHVFRTARSPGTCGS